MRALVVAAAAAGSLSLGIAACGSTAAQDQPVAAKAPREFFGVVPQGLLTDDDLARMAQGRVGTIRLVVPWGALAPDSDRAPVNFASIDPTVLRAAANGVRVVPTIFGTPSWVAEGLDGYSCDPDCGPFAPHSGRALAAWKDFVGRLVDRYGPGGELWKRPSRDPTGARPLLADLERAELADVLPAEGRPGRLREGARRGLAGDPSPATPTPR